MIDPKEMPVGAIVMVRCHRASSSHSTWCRRKTKNHCDLELRGVVTYDPETAGKVVRYVFEDWDAAKEPRGREQLRQQICPHYPKLNNVLRVLSKTGGEKLRCGDEFWVRLTDGTTISVEEWEKRNEG